MATTRSFTGYLTSDLVGTENVEAGDVFTLASLAGSELNIVFQDGEGRADGDGVNNETPTDPNGDQIAFVDAADGATLIDGEQFSFELSFLFTVAGQTFTGYQFESADTGLDFVIFPPGVPAGPAVVNSVQFNPTPNSVAYDALASGDEAIDPADFDNLDLTGADEIIAGDGNDTIRADAGNDTIFGGAGDDSIDGGAGRDVIDAGAGDDTVDGGADGDRIIGNAGDDVLSGGGGADTILGDGGVETLTYNRESFNWSAVPDPNGGGGQGVDDGDSLEINAPSQNTGAMNVSFTYTDDGGGTGLFFENQTQVVADLDAEDGGAANPFSAGRLNGVGVGDTSTTEILFTPLDPTTTLADVRNVQFRINDIDESGFRDIVTITAFNSSGERVVVDLIGGADLILRDATQQGVTDGVIDTVTVPDGVNDQANTANPDTVAHSLLIEIPGPVSRVVIDYGNDEPLSQRIDITDIFFDSVTFVDNAVAGADSIDGGEGDDLIDGQGGADTITGGAGADTLQGGAEDDTFVMTDGYGADSIVGGEAGTDFDLIDNAALTSGVDIAFSADEAGTQSNGGDAASFEEIEAITLTAFDDTVDAGATTGGVDFDGLAGADMLTGGAGIDTLSGGDGADTLDGGAGADLLSGGADQDTFRLTDGFGADIIAGGETGTDFDILDHSLLSTSVSVVYAGEEAGATTDGASAAAFSEIERLVLSGFDDALDATATAGGVSVDAGAGNDLMVGGAGVDTLEGGDGFDTITGGAGADLLFGGAAADRFVLNLGFGADVIVGGEDDLLVEAPPDSSFLDQRFTGDTDIIDLSSIIASPATVTFTGNEQGFFTDGIDTATFSEIEGFVLSAGDDLIDAQVVTSDLTFELGVGNDTLFGGSGGDLVFGGVGADSVVAGAGDDLVFGGDGGDTIEGGLGTDYLYGDVGGDSIVGGDGSDFLFGGDGDDSLFGGDGDDRVYAGEGDDLVIATPGQDTIFGGGGNDNISVGDEADVVYGGSGNDTVDGGNGDDSLFGGDGADSLLGGADNDSLVGGAGSDTLDGGSGDDTIVGDDGVTLVRESFNWSQIPDPQNGGQIDDEDNISGGTTQDTGGVSVTMSWRNDGIGDRIEYQDRALQATAGIDGGGETVSSTSAGRIEGSQSVSGPGDSSTTTFSFASNDPDVLDEVLNVQFRINDIDQGNWRDQVTIRAFNAAGDPIEVQLTAGSDLVLTDTDAVPGADRATAPNGAPGALPRDLEASLLVEVAGPVARIEVDYDNLETQFGAIELTDIFFDTQVVNTAGAGDSIIGGDGNDSILGQQGDDTIEGSAGDDTIFGGDGNDAISDFAGSDSIDGGAGQDTISVFGGDSVNVIAGGADNDTITVFNSAGSQNTIDGGTGDDTIQTGDSQDSILGGEGADTINAGGGDDTIEGGAGDDVIEGAGGDDSILGDEGADSISDFAGFNTVSGGDGDDTINLFGNDSQLVDGGADDDVITVFTGAGAVNTISGGIGDDSITSGDSRDSISGGDGADTITAGGAMDTIFAGAGDDSVDASVGDDEVFGGDGADIIFGGDDDDTIDGGDASDQIFGGDGFDDFIVSAGDDVIADFNLASNQDFRDGDQLNNDFIDLAPYYQNIYEARADLIDDGLLNQSNDTDTRGQAVDYADNTALPGSIALNGVAADDLTFDNTNLICFASGALIRARRGEVPVEALEPGDEVWTLDNGFQPIRWIGSRTVEATGKSRPIRIRAGALGPNAPETDLTVSPQHRVLIRSAVARRMFDAEEILAPAKQLLALDGVDVVEDLDEVTYHHFMFDRHEVVMANGALAESLYTGPEALRAIDRAAHAEIISLFPELAEPGFLPVPARTIPAQGRRIRKLVERHVANAKPLIQLSAAVDETERRAVGELR